ncbi:MAG: cation-translocating P-type ATPase [Blautia sp.]|jgi:cation-transporting ATPase E
MTGLTEEQVKQRIEAGQVNSNENPNTKTYKEIIRENTLTFFNFLNIVLLVLVLVVGSFKNSMFVLIIVINTVIGIIQEIRAKKALDKLAILTASKALVLRGGKKLSISTEEIVMDDVLFLKAGDQIPADAVVLEGSIEVNESLLTGESDTIVKSPKDGLFSGSFVTSGQALCQVVHVGKDNYASKITSEAKSFKKHNSELRNSLDKILKVISIIILPLGIAVFAKQFFFVHATFRASVVYTVAAVLGMIPEGLVLLTSVALTLGSMKLAKQRTLVQELFCIETLARVDTLCLDKTGTITEGTICVEKVEPLMDMDISQAMGNLISVLRDDNATFEALHKYFSPLTSYHLDHIIPFSSDRKYSGAAFSDEGTYLMGAAQFLFPGGNEELLEQCEEYARKGYRILVLAHSRQMNEETELPQGLVPCGLILMTDVIRHEAKDTLAYFDAQGVDLKVISGDDPVTVAAIARKAGLKNADAYVDATTLQTPADMIRAVREYSVFGRVTPKQKKQMVMALKGQGHTVAMTGDGVNDVLALKEADCSIAMASGSDAAKNIANLVLLDSNFAAMPHIVNEGRRVINNIRMAASMFLIKTIFSVLLAVLMVFFGKAYPFQPIQMSIISACAVGIPTFLLAQEANYEKIEEGFLRHVFMNAFPTALSITICVFGIMMVCSYVYRSNDMLGTACVLVTGWNYMAALKRVYSPQTKYRVIVITSMQVIFFAGLLVGQKLLDMRALEFGMILMSFFFMTMAPIVSDWISDFLRWVAKKRNNKKEIKLV